MSFEQAMDDLIKHGAEYPYRHFYDAGGMAIFDAITDLQHEVLLLRDALDDYFLCIDKPAHDAVGLSSIRTAKANHELLWRHNEDQADPNPKGPDV